MQRTLAVYAKFLQLQSHYRIRRKIADTTAAADQGDSSRNPHARWTAIEGAHITRPAGRQGLSQSRLVSLRLAAMTGCRFCSEVSSL